MLFWMLKLRHRASIAHEQDLADAPRRVVDMIIEINLSFSVSASFYTFLLKV